MDLAELKFVVDTKQLELAAKKVAELGAEVSKLNKPMQDLSNNTNKVSTATEKAAKAADNKAKADTKLVDNSSKLDGLLEKLNNRYTDMSDGSTSAEASILQLARTLGATTEKALEPYKRILEDIRGLSKSPFDSAIGSVRSITQEYDSLTYRAELASKGIFLTTNQLKEYSRIANELKGKIKAADLDPTKGEGLAKFNSELKIQQDLYLGIANKVNTLKAAEKERNDVLSLQMKESARLQEASDNLFKYNLIRHKQDQDGYKQDMLEMRKYYSDLEKQSKQSVTQPVQMDAAVDAYRKNQAKVADEAAKANAYLAKEMERVNRLNSESGEVTSVTNNRLIRFEQELKKSGATAEQQASKLAIYRKELIATQKAAGDRQIDYLSRALGPQITDIAVGLATGQAPLTILLQQGGQLRDQFALAGVAGADMGKMLTKATVGMVGSVKDVALAIGGALGGAFLATGKSVKTFMMNITGTSSALEYMRYQIALLDGSNGTLMKAFLRVGSILTGVVATAIFSAIAAFIAYGVALKEVIAQESALSKSINLTGASLGITTDSALALSKQLAGSKGNVGSYVTAITEIAKTGNITSDNLKTVATTIVEVSKITGISADTLAKNFSKISEKPLEGLIPFAKELGTINVEILKQIQGLEKSGKHTEAAKLATEAYAKALKESADLIRKDMGWIESFFYGIGDAAKSMWNSILNLGRKGTLDEQLNKAIDKMKELQNAGGTNTGRKDRMVAYQAEVISGILGQIEAEKKLGETKAKNAKEVTAFEKNLKEQSGPEFKVPEDLYLKKLKEEYKDSTKEIDSESKKLLALNKTTYDLGLVDTGTYLSEETRLIESQNKQKIDLNKAYSNSFEAAKNLQIQAINDMTAKEMSKAKTSAAVEKLEEQRVQSVKSVTEAYNVLTQSIASNNEVLADNNIEQQAKSLAILGQDTKKVIEGAKEFTRTLEDNAAKRRLQIDLESKLAGLAGVELARVKAQIDAEQSHISKLSELEKAALQAGLAMSKLTLSGLDPSDPKYQSATAAVKKASDALEQAKVKSKQEIVQAGIDAEILYYQQEYNKLSSAITDSIVTALIEGGKAGSKKLRDLIVAELRKKITIEISALVNVGMNALIGGGSKGGSFMESIVGSFLQKQIGGIAVGGTTLAAVGSSFMSGLSAGMTGTSVAEAAAAYNAAGMQGVGSGLSAGAAVAPFAGAVGGLAANKLISQDYEISKTMTSLQNVATVASAFVPVIGPLLSIGVGAVSGLANRAFGRKAKQITGEGIVGTLTAQGADVKSFEDWFQKGGWFRSNKSGRNYSAVSSSLQEYLNLSLSGLTATTKTYAAVLGLQANDIDTVTKKIELNLKGLSNEDRQKKIDEALAGFGDELAKKLGYESFDALQKLGEQVLQERYNLETQLLELQGNTTALRAREREQLFETNRGLYDQIKALEAQKAANEAAAVSIKSVTEEINRLRGVNTSQAGLESQFAILTAQARAGDITALDKLPDITRGLEELAGATAVTATDVVLARARLAQSLQDTLGYVGANGFSASSSTASTVTLPPVSASGNTASSTVTAASSNQELLTALVVEIQGLRAEVRADVSHNAKTAKILERVNQDGETLNVTTV
jgi:phage-related minor tail protein